MKVLKTLLIATLFTSAFTSLAQECCRPSNVRQVDFADPFIMLYEGVYYAYGTASDNGFPVLVSDDLETWRVPEGVRDGLALSKGDVWGDYWFWAPEVYHLNGRFYMYFSVQERVAVAVADSPLGPFRQEVKEPMIPDEQCIDNTLFIDDDGRAYMFFDRFNDGLNVWVVELEDDLTTLRTQTLTKCIAVSQDWETDRGRVNEGPFVFKHNGKYYMTYSGNDYRSRQYGIGVAVADSPYGPWVKYDGNPILQNRWGLRGIGHSAMFRDKEGNLRIVFHAHKDGENVHPRPMYISDVTFEEIDGIDIPVVGYRLVTPVIKP